VILCTIHFNPVKKAMNLKLLPFLAVLTIYKTTQLIFLLEAKGQSKDTLQLVHLSWENSTVN
jgi:hypothetical protein